MAGNGIIGALRIVLGLDSAQLEEGVNKAKKKLTELGEFKLGAGLSAGIKGAEESLKEMAAGAGLAGTSLAAMGGVGLAAAVAIGGVAEALKSAREAVNVAAEFGKLSKEIGVSTDFIQEFNFAAKQSDVDVGAADEALKGLNVSLGAVQGNLPRAKQLAVVFADALKITPDQLRGYKDVAALLPVIADRIKNAGSEAEQAAIAKKLGIEALLPLLKRGGDAFNELAQKARDLGIVMDRELIEKAEQAKAKLSEISDVMKAKANVEFANFAGTLVTIEKGFLAAEVAALRFLAAITGTTSADDRIKDLKADLAGLQAQASGRKLSPSEQAAFDNKNSKLAGLQLGQLINKTLAPSEAGSSNGAAKQFVPTKSNGGHVAEASDQAIAQAAKAELQARIALTGDIAKLAVLRLAEVDLERDTANTKLKEEAANHRITAAAALKAIALNDQAAAERKDLVRRQAEEALAAADIAQRQKIGGYYDQIAALEEKAAGTAAERNAIETKNLADRQLLERRALQTQQDADHATAQTTKDAETASLLDLQAAQRVAQSREQQARIEDEANGRAELSLQLQIDLLKSQAEAADTDGKRRTIGLHILELEQKLERLKLEEIIAAQGSTDAEQRTAAEKLINLLAVQGNEHQAAIGSLFDAFDRADSAVSGLASAFKSHDWGHVVQGLVTTFDTIKADLSSGNKFGAIAGAGEAIGGAVGGVAGSTISGVAGGASLGFTVGGPVGAAVGAVIGGIVGFLGGSSADKKAKQQAQQQAAEQAAAHALSVSNEARSLQIALLQSEGKSEEATALQREAAIASVNKENAALEAQLFDLQEAAQKAAAAAAVAAEGHGLQIKLLEDLGDATGALAAKRADELAALNEANRGLQNEIYNVEDLATAKAEQAAAEQAAAQATTAAQANLSAARDREVQALQATVQKYQALADNLHGYAQTLSADALSGGTLADYAAAKSAFFKTVAGGLGSADSLQGVAETFRTASKATASSAFEQARDEARVRVAVENTAASATRQASLAQQSLDAENRQVDAILKVDASVLTVTDAIKALQDAEEAQSVAGAAALAAAIARLSGAEGSSIVPLAPISAMIPSSPATISPATPDSVVDTASIGAGPAGDLAAQVADQSRILVAIATSVGVTADVHKFWNRVGLPGERSN